MMQTRTILLASCSIAVRTRQCSLCHLLAPWSILEAVGRYFLARRRHWGVICLSSLTIFTAASQQKDVQLMRVFMLPIDKAHREPTVWQFVSNDQYRRRKYLGRHADQSQFHIRTSIKQYHSRATATLYENDRSRQGGHRSLFACLCYWIKTLLCFCNNLAS